MSKPTMNCGGEYPEWEFVSKPEGITILDKPDVCKECEFFQICFMNRSSEILGMPISLGEEAMRQMVYLNRMQESGASEEEIGAYIQSLQVTKQ